MFPVNISHLCFDRQTRNPLGEHHLCFQWDPTSGRAPLCVTFTVQAPSGEDAAAYQAFKGDPLAHPADLLQRFPTSTYAGYVLADGAPGFSDQPLSWLGDPDTNIRNYYRTPDGRIGVTQAHIDQEKAAMAAYAKSVGPFLEAHPDFPQAPRIRRQYAMCLGLTGHMPEAMAEIQTLSTGTGKEADEAKAFLGEKAPAKPAK